MTVTAPPDPGRATLDQLTDHVAVLDAGGLIVATNRAWQAFAAANGASAEAVRVGTDYVQVCRRATGPWSEEAPVVAQALEELIAGERAVFGLEYPCHSPDEERWFRMRASRFERDGSAYVAVVHTNVTERRRAQQALVEANRELERRVAERTAEVGELARRLTMVEQTERRRLSQILHDDLQQLLYGIDMRLAMIGQGLQEAEQAGLAVGLVQARGWVKRAVVTTRQLTVDLSPPILRGEGLAQALRWLGLQMEERYGLRVEVAEDGAPVRLDADLRVLLFQAVRELLFNVQKHAGVDQVNVRLAEQSGSLVLHVIDEGQGFDVEAGATREEQASGFGLYSVRERLRLVGGHLEVRSWPGEGTHVEVHVPGPAG